MAIFFLLIGLELEREVYIGELSKIKNCLLYTSDAGDERSSVDLGGRRIIKKKNEDTVAIDRKNNK